jgi:biopolymer transport protein ExbD
MAEAKFTAAQRSKIRRLSVPKDPEPGEEAGELNIVPFLDIIVNILMFVLATVAVIFTATIETSPPSTGGPGVRKQATASLNLTLIVTNDGLKIAAAGGSIATGCDGLGPGITVPAIGKGPDGQPTFDYAALTACAKKLKDKSLDFRDETQIRITASNNISYRKIIECMDAVRTTPEGEQLFPDVVFGVPR